MTDVRLTATNPEDSSVVPVACNSRGELLVEAPGDDYLPTSGGNLTGNLTLGTDNITLDATSGAGTFAGQVSCNSDTSISLAVQRNGDDAECFRVRKPNDNAAAISFFSSGRSWFSSTISQEKDPAEARSDWTTFQTFTRRSGGSQSSSSGRWSISSYSTNNYAKTILGLALKEEYAVVDPPQFQFRASGQLVTSNGLNAGGAVYVTSRSKLWEIVESGGLAHLVEKTREAADTDESTDADQPQLRNIPAELTMVEQQLQKVMERLKMAPEAGWEVWDGSE